MYWHNSKESKCRVCEKHNQYRTLHYKNGNRRNVWRCSNIDCEKRIPQEYKDYTCIRCGKKHIDIGICNKCKGDINDKPE